MANFSVSWEVTETTAKMTAEFTGGDSSFTGTRYAKVTVDGEGSKTVKDTSGGADSYFSCRFTGLDPDTRYSYTVELGYGPSGNIVWLDNLKKTGRFTTDEKQIVIDKWSWTRSNGAASATQTRAAYTASTNQGNTENFSYLVWNDLVDKACEIMDATGHTWDTTYLSSARTKMTSGDRIMTAKRFNSLRNNIQLRQDADLPYVQKGDIIYGSYFVTMAEALNTWIDRL